MKTVEFTKMIVKAIKKSDVAFCNKLKNDEINDLANDIVHDIKANLIAKRQIIVSGSIDSCPDFSIHQMGENITGHINKATDDPDGFDKDDFVGVLKFNLLED